ncbi:MAG: response regulator [Candidatus Aureabacteria bacterium]|nr:response regulator [Candidatus Auribacterota bacterium]
MNKKTILIVEDEEYVRDFLDLLLRDKYIVIGSPDGVDAMNKINITPKIDLILLDLHMPGINGIDLLRTLKKEVDLDIPVIIVTAYSSPEIRDEAVELGVKDFISKPFSVDYLERSIRNIFEKQS